MDAFLKAIEGAGNLGLSVIVLGLAGLLVYVNNERVKRGKTIDGLLKEKEDMYKIWLEQKDQQISRVVKTIANNTISQTNHTTVIEGLIDVVNVLTGTGSKRVKLIDVIPDAEGDDGVP